MPSAGTGDKRSYDALTASVEVGVWLRPPPLDPFGSADAGQWLARRRAALVAHGFRPGLLGEAVELASTLI